MAGSLQKTAMRSMMVFVAFSALMLIVHELHYTGLATFETQSSKIFNHVGHYIADHEPDVLRELEKAVFFHDDDDRGLLSHGDDDNNEEGEEDGGGHARGDALKNHVYEVDSAASRDDDFNDDTVSITFASGGARHTKAGKAHSTNNPKHSARSEDDDFNDDTVSVTHATAGPEGVALFTGDKIAEAVEDVMKAGGSWLDSLGHIWDKASSETESRDSVAKKAINARDAPLPEDDAVAKTRVVEDGKGVAVKITTPDGATHEGNNDPLEIGRSRTATQYVPGLNKVSSRVHAVDTAVDDSKPTRGARGDLVCEGRKVDSEIIYWRKVPEDMEYESPITTHHGEHDDRYITYEYDQGGWNNVRMSMECMIVLAHATGRTLVIPPQQHLYLLGATHKDKEDRKAHDEMGFTDFFDVEGLRKHKGFHMMEMGEFLAKEGVSGGLKGGELPPGNSTKVWGGKLWKYLDRVADAQPEWMGRFVVFPAPSEGYGDPQQGEAEKKQRLEKRKLAFGGARTAVSYDETLQKAHHIHFPADHSHRVLQHFYAWGFFPDPSMQSFYKRFVRDYMRYKDPIQCAGAQLLAYVRNEAYKLDPSSNGEFYAIHARRGDFQFKEVKISASEIVTNLVFENGTSIIPRGAMVYLSTDDPDGKCQNCVAQRKPCTSFQAGSKPPGCPEDPSWAALEKEGRWKVRMLRDFIAKGALKGVNPNWLGMIESIVCSRAKAFAGTYFSTFTGYIHRLRGYHGLGESTYYHHKRFRFFPQMEKSVGHGFSREWRSGWTDDDHGTIL